MFDGLITIAGCDKTIPAMAMALGRLNIPGLDRIRPYCWARRDVL
jgi:dihydroxy-acid dehydratase